MSEGDVLGAALEVLNDAERVHYDRLVATTALLADISFADILVLLPADTGGRAGAGDGGAGPHFVVTAHSRPITSQTVHPDDLLGRVVAAAERPLAALALRTGVSANGGTYLADQQQWVQSLAVPVNFAGRTVAVLVREFPSASDRVWGRLENTYFGLFRRLAGMIADGAYPYAAGPGDHDHPPRVGDGVILLDAWQRVEYLTPNAHSALRRLGINGDPTGRHLAEVGVEPRALRLTVAAVLPHTEEIERNGHSVVARCLPLIQEDTLTGVLMLVRDITELRRADRLLITKNAALAEVHHRVKNNLQTVSSLLSLQSRWLEGPEAKEALAESARRIRLIAAVHEILSEPDGESTPFESVAASLSSLLRESLAPPDAPISIKVSGAVGPLPSEVMTTMAIVLNELVQNAVDHGFGGAAAASADGSEIVVRIGREDSQLHVSVTDNGCGMPDGEPQEGLGLTLVRTLVENDLGGSLVHRSAPGGTTVELTAPLAPTDQEVYLRRPEQPDDFWDDAQAWSDA
ncbi:MAG: sensor histidine kinase [bacterium]|nr:sensor histidine kinase [bacterium]